MNPTKHLAICAEIQQKHQLRESELLNRIAKLEAQRKPLTDEEIQYAFKTNSVMVDDGNAYMVAGKRAINIARAIEAKLKEKNNV